MENSNSTVNQKTLDYILSETISTDKVRQVEVSYAPILILLKMSG